MSGLTVNSLDKTLLNSFNKKNILTDEKELKLVDQQIVNNMILQDIDKLGKAMDSEMLSSTFGCAILSECFF